METVRVLTRLSVHLLIISKGVKERVNSFSFSQVYRTDPSVLFSHHSGTQVIKVSLSHVTRNDPPKRVSH